MLTLDELVGRVRGYDPGADAGALDRAWRFSSDAHRAQVRDSGEPYFSHPVEVAEILAGYRLDTSSIVTALLHDTVEDTGATIAEIERLFGGEIGRLVDGVTKLSRLDGQTAAAGQAENFRKLLLAISDDIRVLLVKLADRLHNMRTLGHVASPEKRGRVARETMEIYAPLAERIGVQEIKEELENLAFRELYPDACESISSRLDFLQGQGGDVVARVSAEIGRVLDEGELDARVTGRVKRPVSIWRKMQRKHVPFERLTDIIAFRVVVASVEDCYKALGLIHTAYRVIPGEFDDYVSTPKRNGYQSLHTAVIGPDLNRIEVQIRTTQMDQVADLGVAAHWQYKQGAALTGGRHYSWVRRLLDVMESAASLDEFLEDTKLEMYSDQVFCFTPKGEIITLPQGATPVDFAYAVHSEIGDRCVGSRINGKMAPLRTELGNGDQVEILTSEDGGPSPTWERWVVTGKARSRIRRHARDERRDEFMRLGRAMLEREFRAASLSLENDLSGRVCARFGVSGRDDLVEAVGRGNVAARQVAAAAAPAAARPAVAAADGPPSAIPIRGLTPGMAVHYAECCHPLPGDRIVGILARGEGVSIHTSDCETLETFGDAPELWVDVAWDLAPSASESRVGRIDLVVANERGALGKLTTLIARHDGNISNLKITERSEDFFRMALDIDVASARQLNEIVAALRTAPVIASVDRARG